MTWWKYVVAAAMVAVTSGVLHSASLKSDGIASPLLLLNVVTAARLLGLGPALLTAAIGAICYSYFFLPPEGFGIEKPEDWIAFVTFTVTAFITGELASRAERRAAEAQAGRREIERLYRELQAAFERASEAEAARRNEALKAALLDALRHNLRTPLTAIKAEVTALIGSHGRRFEPQLTIENRTELLQVIDEESDRLNRFIEGLSTAPGAERSEPVQLRAVEVDAIVRAGLSRAETVTRDHRLVVDVPRGLPPVAVDASAMVEVIYILLDNASKYAPARTAITLRAWLENERELGISVADEGPGIPSELRERVFENFFRVPVREPHDPRRGGVGLGLPIARRLVETQAGRIWIEGAEGAQGTRAVLVLPVAADVPEVERPAAAVGL